jgi:hypothetical protein
MATHPPKMPDTVGVKLTEEMARQVKAISEHLGMTESGWVRSLIEAAISEKEREYHSLHIIFGDRPELSKGNPVYPVNGEDCG